MSDYVCISYYICIHPSGDSTVAKVSFIHYLNIVHCKFLLCKLAHIIAVHKLGKTSMQTKLYYLGAVLVWLLGLVLVSTMCCFSF